MLTAKNLTILTGGLTRDPEEANGGALVTLSVGVDNAGNVKDEKNPSGYFDVKFWLTDNKFSSEANIENVKNGLASGALKKGTRVSIVGRLVQERWKKDDKVTSKVVIVAESIDFFTGAASTGAPVASTTNAAVPAAAFNASEF